MTKHTRWKVNKLLLRFHCPIEAMKSRKWDAVNNDIAASSYLNKQLLYSWHYLLL